MLGEFSRLALSGDPYSIGHQYGTQLATATADNLEVYFGLFKHYAGLDRLAVLACASEFVRIIDAFDEDLMAA